MAFSGPGARTPGAIPSCLARTRSDSLMHPTVAALTISQLSATVMPNNKVHDPLAIREWFPIMKPTSCQHYHYSPTRRLRTRSPRYTSAAAAGKIDVGRFLSCTLRHRIDPKGWRYQSGARIGMEEQSSASPAEAPALTLQAASATDPGRPVLLLGRAVVRHPWWVIAAWVV